MHSTHSRQHFINFKTYNNVWGLPVSHHQSANWLQSSSWSSLTEIHHNFFVWICCIILNGSNFITAKMRMELLKNINSLWTATPSHFLALWATKAKKESQFHGSNLVLPEICYCYHHRRLIEIVQDPPISKSKNSVKVFYKRMVST